MLSNQAGGQDQPPFALFTYGFRPFFVLAGVWAMVPMATILWTLVSGGWPENAAPLFTWHGHEMLFGFVPAAFAGFLLTAVPTWTGIKAISGGQLIVLVLLWGFGRLGAAPFVQSPSMFIQLLGVAFLPALAVSVAVPLIRTKNFRNLPFLALLVLMFAADLAYQAVHFGWSTSSPVDGLRLALNTVLLLVTVVGGRIVPAFTRNALVKLGRPAAIKSFPSLDAIAIASVASVLIGDLLIKDAEFTGVLAGLAAILLGARLSHWLGWRTLDVPLLWILHLGYSWVIVGLALKAFWLLGEFGWAMNWMHALTAGAFGTMILGVMTRVALGHTGRELTVSRLVVASYLLISTAAVLRVWGPWVAPGYYWQALSASMLSWITGFGIFLFVYTPILVRARVDAKLE